MSQLRRSQDNRQSKSISNLARSQIISRPFAQKPQLSQSRIKKLPNHSLNPISLQIATLLQAIQIDRLSDQLKTATITLKQYKNKAYNATSYQVQIRQLSQRYQVLQNQRIKHQDQKGKLTGICQQLYQRLESANKQLSQYDYTLKDRLQSQMSKSNRFQQQVQQWKMRYIAMQKAKSKQIDDVRMLMQSQRKSMIDREITQLKLKFSGQRGQLQNKIKSLRQSLQMKVRQIQQQKGKISRIQFELQESKQRQRNANKFQQSLIRSQNQNMQLNQALRSTQNTLRSYMEKISVLQKQQLSTQKLYHDYQMLSSSYNQKIKQLQNKSILNSSLQNDLQNARQAIASVHSLRSQVNNLHNQNNKLSLLLRDKTNQNQQWSTKVESLKKQLIANKNTTQYLYQAQAQISHLKSQLNCQNNTLRQRLGQIQQLNQQIIRYQNQLSKYQLIKKQFTTLKQQSAKTVNQISMAHNKLVKLQNQNKQLLNKQNQYQTIIYNERIQKDRLNHAIRNYLNQIQTHKQILVQMQQNQSKYQQTKKLVSQYQNKIHNLTYLYQQKNQQLYNKNSHISKLQQHNKSLTYQINRYSKLQQQINQFQTKQLKWNKQKQQILGQKARYYQQTITLSNNLKKADQINRKLPELAQQINNKNDMVMKLSYENQQLKQLNSNLSKQYQEVNNEMLKQKHMVNELGSKLLRVSAQLQRLSQSEKQFQRQRSNFSLRLHQINQKTQAYQSKIMTLKGINLTLQRSLQQFKQKHQQCPVKMNFLSKQIQLLTMQNSKLQQQLKHIRLRYSDSLYSDRQFNQNNIRFVLMAAQIQTLRKRINQTQNQYQTLKKSFISISSSHP